MLYFDAAIDEGLLDEAVDIARRGVMLDDRDAFLRFIYGRALLGRKDYREALSELETAVQLNPNLAVVYCGVGDSLAYDGRTQEAIAYFERAVGLSPHDPQRWAFYSYGALAHLFAGAFETAAEWAHKATRVPNCHYWGFAHRVAALGHLRREEDLKVALRDLRKMKPDFTCALARERLFYLKDPTQVEIYIDGLRRAGVSEQ
jgi:tetratricopeptide (TPR) repeat protein